MLSLFTGHPLDFFQCLYYLTSILIVPFYISLLRNLSITLPNSPARFKNSTINKISFLTVLYNIDTVLSLLFTLYFSWFWFSGTAELQDSEVADSIRDDISKPKQSPVAAAPYAKRENIALLGAAILARAVDTNTSSESASTTYETFFTVSSILAVSIIRIYFDLILLSFTRTLIKGAKYNSVNDDDDDEYMNTDFLKENIFKRKLRELEIRSANFLKQFFN